MANKAQESRELTKMNSEMEIIINKMKLNADLTKDEQQRLVAYFTFGHLQFKLMEKQYKEYQKIVKKYLKEHDKIWKGANLIELHFEERSRGRKMDVEYIINKLSYADLKTLLLNTKNIPWDKKTLSIFFTEDELSEHSTDQVAEYLLPKKRLTVDSEPKELRLDSKYVQDMLKQPRLLLEE